MPVSIVKSGIVSFACTSLALPHSLAKMDIHGCYSFSRYLLITCYLPCFLVGARDVAMTKINEGFQYGTGILVGRDRQ